MTDRRRVLLLVVAAAALVFLVVIEIEAQRLHFSGPTSNLLHDFAFGPKRGRLLWAGAALAMVGLNNRQRITWLAIGAAIDLAFVLGRLTVDSRATFGNGAMYLLVGLTVYATTRWRGDQRLDALKGIGLGALLIMASKISDSWLTITARTRPTVLDEYAQTADHALGNPSWWMGELVDATGQLGHLILQTIYIDLPLAAIVVAVYQLRRGWPSHHLVRTFLLIGLIGPLFYLLFPVVGPIFAFGSEGHGWAVANVWPRLPAFDLNPGSITFDDITPRNCMPSLHTAWVVAIFVHTRQAPRWLRIFGTVWMVCTLIATLGFGYHYGVDLIAGVVFSLTIEAALRDPERGWGWFRWRLVLGGSATMAALLFSYRFLAVPLAEEPMISGLTLIGLLVAVIVAFYATFFARPGTALAEWGQREERTASRASTATPVGA